ncbi:Transcriptional regulatory protein QseB [Marine Group I thaumarchaeote SCGC AAA799-E16]|uniref:Transcriptional regulatory protein QseB n=5 Tax=Marine Group I TaxID=905826 RepID=A0A087S7I8_9ARCH|nr:Transcriptional regulatory protein QseB [Marine Group I thaumarchaeote SCGC AAA799-N04]KER06983.1 Transcriptional regulatory protein QseB [Marine Group I thaumarchaeote SCGC AAA799-E16]KFM16919.1 Transcriptional regulatory protein QseB [Marine Group I thaumarchaeote SCGC AAA799-D11]KFM18610.1 Transcriptional regulatory protein SrrA [Marine Group I thaumarchaeote SCGC RSA3]KFM21692.1 Transcriptional regulatory protein QseB [Marine Group I thaumarchaeote SCGC AAA799-B03]
MLAAECKKQHGKDSENEIAEAGDLFLKYSNRKDADNVKGALLCASKCFLSLGDFDKARDTYQQAKTMFTESPQITRPVVIIDDSKAIALKLQTYVEKLGYSDIHVFENGKTGVKGCKDLFSEGKHPILLLDMGLPDLEGDTVAEKLLKEKLDLQIVVITADEKTTERVNKTLSSGVSAFIQKPFTLDEVKKAIDVAESEYDLLQ